jgi:hypothetical protein
MRIAAVLVLLAGSASAAPLIESTGDVDGAKGVETLRLEPDGTLHAGPASIRVELDDSHPAFDRQRRISVVPLGGKRRGVLLVTPAEGSEDPPNRNRVYLYANRTLRPVFDNVGDTPMFDARGVGRYFEDVSEACERAWKPDGPPPKVRLVRFTLRLDRAGKRLVSTGRRTNEVFDCDHLSG